MIEIQDSVINRKKHLYDTQLDYIKVLIQDNKKQQALQNMNILVKKLEYELKNELTTSN